MLIEILEETGKKVSLLTLWTAACVPGMEWKRHGFSKGTLHYMKKNAEGNKPFTLNKHVRERLDQWDQSVDQRGSTVDLGMIK